MQSNTSEIRRLIDTIFSLNWCRENIVAPLGVERNDATGSQRLTIAIGNFSYLATIGDFIKERSEKQGFECQFIEKPAHEIKHCLIKPPKNASSVARVMHYRGQFSDDAVLDALKGVEDRMAATDLILI